MATPTRTPLATVTLPGSDSFINFSGFPSSYRSIILVLNCSLSTSAGGQIRVNGDSGSNYVNQMMRGTSSGASAAAETGTNFYANWGGSTQLCLKIELFDYSLSTKHTSTLMRNDYISLGAEVVEAIAGVWNATTPVTSISVQTTSGSFNAGGTISIYGVN